jgi:hypothetical protein
MASQIERDYFEWLVSQIEVRSRNTYNDLFQRMHDTEFVWTIPHDDDRLNDGRDLRVEFLNGTRHTFEFGVSILEVLIALSRRTAFNAGGEARQWAWHLIENLRLNKASDPFTNGKANRVDDILEALIWRTYAPDGSGGFFPLKYPQANQTKIDIWFQMQAYVNEIHD